MRTKLFGLLLILLATASVPAAQAHDRDYYHDSYRSCDHSYNRGGSLLDDLFGTGDRNRHFAYARHDRDWDDRYDDFRRTRRYDPYGWDVRDDHRWRNGEHRGEYRHHPHHRH